MRQFERDELDIIPPRDDHDAFPSPAFAFTGTVHKSSQFRLAPGRSRPIPAAETSECFET